MLDRRLVCIDCTEVARQRETSLKHKEDSDIKKIREKILGCESKICKVCGNRVYNYSDRDIESWLLPDTDSFGLYSKMLKEFTPPKGIPACNCGFVCQNHQMDEYIQKITEIPSHWNLTPLYIIYKCKFCGKLWQYDSNPDSYATVYEEFIPPPQAKQEGCYIATACYGSDKANEVLVLRKFRDVHLNMHFWGRCFIRLYYQYAPYVAEKLKNKAAINNFIRIHLLDRLVQKLKD